MSKNYLISMLCASLLLSGCDHYTTKMAAMEQSNANPASIAPAAGGETTFSGYLAAQYYQLANYEQRVTRDYPAAKNYFTKAEALSSGQMVILNRLSDYNIESHAKAELIEANQEIQTALQENSIAENRRALATAHSRYDCWVDEAEERKEASTCKTQFRQAMNSLIIPQDVYDIEEPYYDEIFDLDV